METHGVFKERTLTSLLVLDVQASRFTGRADLRVATATEAPGIRAMVHGNKFMLPISLGGFL